MVLEGVECVIRFGGSEYDLRGVGEAVQQLEAVGSGHFYVQEDQVRLVLIEECQGIMDVQEMSFYVNEAAFLTELLEKISGDLDIFDYDTSCFHPILMSWIYCARFHPT